MSKLSVFFVLCFLTIYTVMPMVHSIAEDPHSVNKWFEKLPKINEKVTMLHFYFHDRVSGNNETSYRVAQPNTTSPMPNNFGFVFIADNPLTRGPNPNSEEVGRAQGMYGLAAMDQVSMLMDLNLVFTKGKYKGSTLNLVGRNPIFHKYREISIVGGSGIFRLARGIATAKTFTFDPISLNAIVEYHVVVLHY